MPSKAKSALLNGTFEAPDDSFLGEMIDDDSLKEESSINFIKEPENIDSSLEDSFLFEDLESNKNIEKDESEFLKSKNINEVENEEIESENFEEKDQKEFGKDTTVEDDSIENSDISQNTDLNKNNEQLNNTDYISEYEENSKPHRKRGRPRSNIKTEKEEIKMPENSKYDEIINILANNLIDEFRKTDLTISGFNVEQIQPIYDYIKSKINN